MIWFTSDLHFGHNKEFIYQCRGFPSIQNHDEAIIKKWNELVSPDDQVYILGDLMLEDNKHGIECLKQLKGSKAIILGNHDTAVRRELYKEIGDILGYADLVKIGKYRFYLSHYPSVTLNSEKSTHLGEYIINLFGHTHQLTNFYNDIPVMYHVGVDSHNYRPVALDTIIADIKNKMQESPISCKEEG